MAWRGGAPPTFGILSQRLSLLLLLLFDEDEEHKKGKGKNICAINSQPTLPLLLRTLAFSHTGDSLKRFERIGVTQEAQARFSDFILSLITRRHSDAPSLL